MRSIEVLPEILQTRAGLNMDWAKRYAEDMAKGELFDAVLVYLLPDGRYVLADGFHRHWAARKIGKREILAFVREGSISDALLAGIAANMDEFHRGLKITAADRLAAVEKLIRNEDTREWSDKAIGGRCGVATGVVRKTRVRMFEQFGIAIPDFVRSISGGVKRRMLKYKLDKQEEACVLPVYEYKGRYSTKVNQATVSLGSDHDKAIRKASEISASISEKYRCLASGSNFDTWLARRNVKVESGRGSQYPVQILGDRILLRLEDATNRLLYEAIGKATVDHLATGFRVIIAWTGVSNGTCVEKAIGLIHTNTDWLRFMTPDEIVERFAVVDAPQAEASACR